MRILLFSFFVLNAVAFAQTGTIQGKVYDDSSFVPLQNATITILKTGLKSVSSNRGDFIVSNIPFGSYVIEASCEGYSTLSDSVHVRSDTASVMHFCLKKLKNAPARPDPPQH